MGMVYFFVMLCYILTAYGACNIIAFSDGPFHIFSHLRNFADSISEHFGKMFKCMMCLPANFGWICSIVNWFLIPISYTPFNIIFHEVGQDLWWLAALCDGALTSGAVYILYLLTEYIEKKIDYYESNTYFEEEETKDKILVEDITQINDHE